MPTFEAVDWDLLVRVLFAIGIGGLIGLEREWHKEKGLVAGIRTLPLVALSGVLLVFFSEPAGTWVVALGVAVFGGLTWQMVRSRALHGYYGYTTPMAFLITFLAGLLAGYGHLVEAAVVAVATALLLLEKGALHRFAGVLTEDEIQSALQFLAVAFIALPLAPRQPVGPWDAIVPRTLVWIVVIVSTVSFLGFLAMRRFGASRGMVASGVLAGLVDSDAAAGAVAALARERPALHRIALRAGLLAVATSFVRNIVLALIAGVTLFWYVAPGFLVMALVPLLWAFFATRRASAVPAADLPRVRSPFAVWPALKFAAFFAVVSLVAVGLQNLPGGGGWAVYLTAVGGLVSSAAVVASMAATAANGALPLETAAVVAMMAGSFSAWVKPFLVGAVYRPVGRALLWPGFFAGCIGMTAAVALAWIL